MPLRINATDGRSVVETPSDEQSMEARRESLRLDEMIRRVEKQRSATGKPVKQMIDSFDPAFLVYSAKSSRRENDLTHDEEVCSTKTVDGYLTSMLAKTGVLGSMFSPAFAPLVFSSVDPEHLCKLRNLPQSEVTVERCWAHIEALDTGLPPEVVSSLARMTTLALLNTVEIRHAKEKGAAVLRQDSKPNLSNQKVVEPRVELPAPVQRDKTIDEEIAPPGRTVAGFAVAAKDSWWAGEGNDRIRMAKGDPLLLVEPTQNERASASSSEDMVMVWWNGASRRMLRTAVSSVRRNEYLELVKKGKS